MNDEPCCPLCQGELLDMGGVCGDNDPDCECDTYWRCEKCNEGFIEPCPAHQNYNWGRITIIRSTPAVCKPGD